MAIEKVGVVGCGLMGSGIAEVAAKAGHHVVVREVSEEALASGRKPASASVRQRLERSNHSLVTCNIPASSWGVIFSSPGWLIGRLTGKLSLVRRELHYFPRRPDHGPVL